MAEKSNEKDPLDKLFVRSDEVNRELLSDLLIKYVRITTDGNIFTMSNFYDLTNKMKLVVLLLARKAVSLKTGIQESMAPKEIAKLVDIPEGSLRPTLRNLVEERIAEEKESKYQIYPHAIERCYEMFNRQETDGTKQNNVSNPNKKSGNKKISMRDAIELIIKENELNEGKTAKEILKLVQQKRPGTINQALYKVILDLVQQQPPRLSRDLQGGTWVYKRVIE